MIVHWFYLFRGNQVRARKILSLAFCILSTASVFSQHSFPIQYPGSAINYVRTWDATKPISNADSLHVGNSLQIARIATAYFDGLGRKIQTIIKEGSLPTGDTARDLTSAVIYDELGREIYHYLPFRANTEGGNTSLSDGRFKLNPFEQQTTFNASHYPGETFFYGKTNYEPSPLNRVTSSYAPGNSWAGSETAGNPNDRHGTLTGYHFNKMRDSVRIWEVDTAGASSTTHMYPGGELYKTITTDEHKKQIVEYKDKEGVVILRKVQLATSPDTAHDGWLCTYYVYGDVNELRLVIPPKAVKELADNGWNLTQTILDELCFRYEYDERGRAIVKKVPGAAELRMVYDARDRMVLSQDGNLRTNHVWLYTQYDTFNRSIATGLITDPVHSDDHAWHRVQASGSGAYPALESYTSEELTRTFYDTYSWRSDYGNPLGATLNTTNSGYLLSADNTTYPYPQAVTQSNKTKTLITGTRVKILGTNTYLYSVHFYDAKVRLIQIQATNVTGGTDVLTTQYSWSGLPLLTIQEQRKEGANPQTTLVLTKLSYDDLGRTAKIEKKVGSSLVNSGTMPGTWTVIAEHEYDAVGQLKKTVLGSGLESLTYDYNIRGWTFGMNRAFLKDSADNYFGFELAYDKTGTVIPGTSYAGAQYTGNIAGMLWKSKGDHQPRKYDFTYDAANRLLAADFNQYTGGTFNKTAGIDFSVTLGNGSDPDSAYDYNGNILRLQQWGLKGFESSQIDDLRYTYASSANKLKNVIDQHNDTVTALGDFRSSALYMTVLGGSKTNGAVDYAYDDNGNITMDLNKDIASDTAEAIEYNHLNLPVKLRVKDRGSIEYTYDALGNKLKRTVKESGKPNKTTLYIGGVLYENDTLQFISHEEGRIRSKADSVFLYDYFLKDHLGNVRMVLTKELDDDALYFAGMEPGDQPIEEQLFTQIPETAFDKPNGFDSDTANHQVSKLYGTNGNDNRIGLGLVLKVMAGDKFRAGVKGWYQPNVTNPNTAEELDDIVTALIGSFTGGMQVSGTHGTGGAAPGSAQLTVPLQAFIDNSHDAAASLIPKAYLNWIVLDDKQFKLVEENYGAIRIPEITDTAEKQTMVANGGDDIEIKRNGYLYVYVSNESKGNVYFDELSIVHTRGAILEETHYYPFGLVMSGISSKALTSIPNNKYKFNGIEQNTDFDLNMYDAFYRTFDPQLGRFWQIDPKPNLGEAPYTAMSNNPVLYNDVLGDTVKYAVGAGGDRACEMVAKYASRITINTKGEVVRNKNYNAAFANIIGRLDQAVDNFVFNFDATGTIGAVAYDGENVNITIADPGKGYGTNDGAEGVLFEETKHAEQVLDGKATFGKNLQGEWKARSTLANEVEAKLFAASGLGFERYYAEDASGQNFLIPTQLGYLKSLKNADQQMLFLRNGAVNVTVRNDKGASGTANLAAPYPTLDNLPINNTFKLRTKTDQVFGYPPIK